MLLKSAVERTRKFKDDASAYAGMYVLDKIARSAPARMHMATVPLSLAATLIKSVVQFLILYRLATGTVWVDTAAGLVVSAMSALCSPFFFALVKQHEHEFLRFTHLIADRAMQGDGRGIEFVAMVKSRLVLSGALVLVAVLLVVEVNSAMLIRLILEYLVALWVSEQVNTLRDNVYMPVAITPTLIRTPAIVDHVLTKYDYIAVVPPKASRAVVANTWAHPKVQRVKAVARKRMADTLVTVIDDWNGGN